MKFNIPVDFGYGGYSVFDGVTMKEFRGDIWGSDPLAFTTTVSPGLHVLEVIGGEGCCDGEQEWSFEIVGGSGGGGAKE
jgi:hypothetical protein